MESILDETLYQLDVQTSGTYDWETYNWHGKKGFVIPTKSFVEIGMKKNILLQQQNV